MYSQPHGSWHSFQPQPTFLPYPFLMPAHPHYYQNPQHNMMAHGHNVNHHGMSSTCPWHAQAHAHANMHHHPQSQHGGHGGAHHQNLKHIKSEACITEYGP